MLPSCSGADDGAADTTPAAATQPGTAAGSSSASEDDSSLSLEEAADVAVKAVDDSSLLAIETAPGRTIWEATVVTGDGTEHEMLIAMSDGSLVDGPTRKVDDAEDKAENRARVAAAELDHQEAARAISHVVGGARLMEL